MGALRTVARPLPPTVQRLARRQLVRYRHRGLRAGDALLVSYPKSGSTWLRFLLADALTSHETDFDSVRDTVPPMGRHRHAPALLPAGGRLIRTHEPARPSWGRSRLRIVSLVRDGRHVALSYLAHQRRYGRFDGDAGEFVEQFLRGEVDSYGPWHEHVLAAVALEDRPDVEVLGVRYEDLRAAPVDELARVLDFLGAGRRPPAAVPLDVVVERNDKDGMRAKEASSRFLASLPNDGSPFVRPDRGSEWEELVPPASRARFDEVCGTALRAAGYGLA